MDDLYHNNYKSWIKEEEEFFSEEGLEKLKKDFNDEIQFGSPTKAVNILDEIQKKKANKLKVIDISSEMKADLLAVHGIKIDDAEQYLGKNIKEEMMKGGIPPLLIINDSYIEDFFDKKEKTPDISPAKKINKFKLLRFEDGGLIMAIENGNVTTYKNSQYDPSSIKIDLSKPLPQLDLKDIKELFSDPPSKKIINKFSLLVFDK